MEEKITLTGKEAKAFFEAELAYEVEGMTDEAEERVYEVLDLLNAKHISKQTKMQLIIAFGNMVGEMSSLINGYFDENGIDKSFVEFIW